MLEGTTMNIDLKTRILLTISAMARAAAGPVSPVNPSLTGSARTAAIRAHAEAEQAAAGWCPTPKLAGERAVRRAIEDLRGRGLVQITGENRGRRVRLTEAGRAAAEAIEWALAAEVKP